MNRPVYVFGHKNPDADAICSAIGYAAYKNATGMAEAAPARCGNSNARIEAILDRFSVPLPPFISDVTPRVKDIMQTEVITVKPDATYSEALELMDIHDLRTLPVVNDGGQVEGLVNIFDLGETFLPKPKATREMRRVETSLASIVHSLRAKVLNLVDEDRIEELFVRVGAMEIRSFGRFQQQEETRADQSIIVVGDRWDIQEKSIQIGVRLLVITGDLEIEPDIVDRARKNGISLIVSSYDSATTSWIIRSAARVERSVQRDIMTFGPEERLASVRRRIGQYPALAAFPVLNDQQELLGIFSKTDLLKPVPTRIMLVDHNELGQAVNGANEVTILEIIDHHRLGNSPTEQPILFINEPVGSTSAIVAGLFRRDGLTPEPAIAGVLMGGMISDTLNLKGPTTTDKDRELLAWLEEIAGVPADTLAGEIFASGSVVLSHPPEEVITSDCKVYEEGPLAYSVAQVEELGFENFWNRKADIVDALKAYRQQEDLYFSGLLVTDINSQNSLLVVDCPDEMLDQITYAPVERGRIFDLPGVVSRKKQLIPYLTTILRGLGAGV
ncbi:MAG: putative manganese-dependent inorganic diphosphatase [Opitutales bacterium]